MASVSLAMFVLVALCLWALCEVAALTHDPWSWQHKTASVGSTIFMAMLIVGLVLFWTAV